MTDVPLFPHAPVAPHMSLLPSPSALRVMVIAPSRRVHLYSRPHIDLQRVAGALCRP
ncbi:putative leader peptide [Streptomyces sp. NPDC048436]|uniref:putative leader peptide n=1 Tax=Streptomyces sp. NPDC048436 TaxID=3365550 RepID=UPI00371742E1